LCVTHLCARLATPAIVRALDPVAVRSQAVVEKPEVYGGMTLRAHADPRTHRNLGRGRSGADAQEEKGEEHVTGDFHEVTSPFLWLSAHGRTPDLEIVSAVTSHSARAMPARLPREASIVRPLERTVVRSEADGPPPRPCGGGEDPRSGVGFSW